MDSSDLSDGAVTLQEYLELKKALATSEAKVQQLMKVNSSLSDELRRLQREVRVKPQWEGGGAPGLQWVDSTLHPQIHKLQAENLQLRQTPGPVPTPPLPSERAEHTPMAPGGSSHRRDRQAFSMYEPGSALKPFGGPPGDELTTRLQPFHSTVSHLWVSQRGEMGRATTGSTVTLAVLTSPGARGRRDLFSARPCWPLPGKQGLGKAGPS
ncbi:Plasma membrane permease, mediates uptake of glycerophosphoinositol and glycerophosphocholine [Saguinus oedipus]|uniref:Plasma membrane permease, mediates uptake of glycerophosphoinositol and glycerophosphocholine n=1 Tax=Saguinus oedipus TaxID=9490 RepID=A0ABQ9VQ02_SAGOE|nr:Plasma membrane permease, mediates uptake of glycerophosphoinositol and glycerophosphocholine [Saguinus oedipus]